MKKSLFKPLLLVPIVVLANLIPSQGFANSVQIFTGLAFDNPARLMEVKDQQFIFDLVYLDASLDFSGTSTGGTGRAHGNSRGYLPYFRYATRLNQQFVVGVDVTEPFFTDIQYPKTSIIRYAAVRTHLDTTTISPNVSWQIHEKFSIGAGWDAQYGRANLDSMVPTRFGDQLFQNSGKGWSYGGHFGFFYKPSIATNIGISYYSHIAQVLRGPSSFIGRPTTSDFTTVNLPATTTLHFMQAFSKKIAMSGSIIYSEWSVLKNITIRNSALGNLAPIPFNYRNTWRFALGGQYKFTDKFAFRGGVAYDQSPSNNRDRGVALPTQDILGVGVGVLYEFFKEFTINLDYAHSFIRTAAINNVRTLTFGSERMAADRIEGRVTINL